MVNFSDWKIRYSHVKDKQVDDCLCHLDWSNKVFELQIGTKEGEWEGQFYSKRDISLVEGHEVEHALMLIEGVDKGCMNLWMYSTLEEKIKVYDDIMKIEKIAWRRFLDGLTYKSVEWLSRAQDCMNHYIFRRKKSLLEYV